MGISPAHQRFIDEYTANPRSGADAARRAGYSPSRAKTTAYELLRKPEIAEAIKLKQEGLRELVGYSREDAVKELMAILKNPKTGKRVRLNAIRLLGLFLGLYPGGPTCLRP
jgi:hypothetical protein